MQSRPPAIYSGAQARGLVNALIVGGDANWRISTARELHRTGPGQGQNFMSFDARRDPGALVIALRTWMLDPAAGSPDRLLEAGTLYVEHVTELEAATQALMLSFGERVTDRRVLAGAPSRLIAGSGEDPWLASEQGRFSTRLCDCLDKLRIQSPLRRSRSVA